MRPVYCAAPPARLPSLLRRLAHRAVAGELRPQRGRLQRLVEDDDVLARRRGARFQAAVGGGEDRGHRPAAILAQGADRLDPVALVEMIAWR